MGRWLLLALVLAGAGLLAERRYGRSAGLPLKQSESETAESLVTPGVRIKVEVLNATKVRGLAHQATMFLRDRGFDVVAVGTSSEQRTETVVFDRSNHAAWAELAARAFNAKVEEHPDSSRYLDVTVLVGANWRPPAKPFYP